MIFYVLLYGYSRHSESSETESDAVKVPSHSEELLPTPTSSTSTDSSFGEGMRLLKLIVSQLSPVKHPIQKLIGVFLQPCHLILHGFNVAIHSNTIILQCLFVTSIAQKGEAKETKGMKLKWVTVP